MNWIQKWTALFRTYKSPKRNDSLKILTFGGEGQTQFATLDVSQHRVLNALLEKVAVDLSQLKVAHWKDEKELENTNLLQVLMGRVNELETPLDLYSKIAYRLLVDSNAFIYIKRDKKTTKVVGLYIADYSQTTILKDKSGNIWVDTTLEDGTGIITSYDNVIHLKRRYMKGTYGTPMINSLHSTLELLDINDESTKKQLLNANSIKGILRYDQNLNPTDLLNKRESFVKETISTKTGSSIAVIDAGAEYIDLKQKTTLVSLDQKHSEYLVEEVYKFFNISPNIVSGKYNQEEYAIYLQSIISPIAKSMSVEFTLKLLTPSARKKGEKIEFSTIDNELTNLKTKGEFLRSVVDLGLFNINEGRELVGYPPIEGGDVHRVSLNFANKDIVDDYQQREITNLPTNDKEEQKKPEKDEEKDNE